MQARWPIVREVVWHLADARVAELLGERALHGLPVGAQPHLVHILHNLQGRAAHPCEKASGAKMSPCTARRQISSTMLCAPYNSLWILCAGGMIFACFMVCRSTKDAESVEVHF